MARLIELVVDEGKWLPFSTLVGALAVGLSARAARRGGRPPRDAILAALNAFAGALIATMAFGHLLAVSVKLALGTLREGSLVLFYAIGVILMVPALAVLAHTRTLVAGLAGRARTIGWNGGLAASLVLLGLHNLPLAAPAMLTIAYRLHERKAVGWAIVGLAVTVNLGLFVASLVFLASGQSFEQFRGLE